MLLTAPGRRATTREQTGRMTAPRAVLVTGASRGIGRAIASAFAHQGDRVAVHVRSAVDEGEATRDSLPGEGHALVVADLGDACLLYTSPSPRD